MEHVVKRRNSIVRHIARMPHTVPAHQALHCQVELSLARLSDSSWKCRPGRPNKRWLDQIRDDNNRPPADVWRDAVRRGHSGTMQWSTPIERQRRRLLLSGGCCYFSPGPWLLSQPKRTLPLVGTKLSAWWQRHTGVSGLSKAITQWCPARTGTRDL